MGFTTSHLETGIRIRWPAPGVVVGGVEHLATGLRRPAAGTIVKLRCGALYQMSTHRKTIVGRCVACFEEVWS